MSIEKSNLDLGIMPLTDCAPFTVAKELGFFASRGLEVTLHIQNSWVGLRDKLSEGTLDAGHLLAPMALACSLGLGSNEIPMVVPMVLSRNGNAITISEPLVQEIKQTNDIQSFSLPMSAHWLKRVIEHRAQAGTRLKFATVYPYSCHYYQLLTWLQQSGLPDSAIDILIIPPSHMVQALEQGDIDGFCVGGPWNAKAVRQGAGLTGVTSSDIWPDFPEKVLGVTALWQRRHPNTTLALVAALQQACDWLQSQPNRFEAARMLAHPGYLNTDLDVLAPSLLGSCLTYRDSEPRYVASYNQFASNNPDPSYGERVLVQMAQAGHLDGKVLPEKLVNSVFRPDIYQQAMAV